MTDYTKATNFATKDALVTGDPLKAVKGTEIDDEFNAIEDAVETKANLASPTFTGTPKAPTASLGTSTTQIATTAFVNTEVDNAIDNLVLPDDSVTSSMIAENAVTSRELNVADDGTSGQLLQSDGDGSFSWYSLPGAASNPFIEPAATDPTERDDASALQEGDIYYNTDTNKLKSYDGTDWQGVGSGIGEGPVLELGAEMPSSTVTSIRSATNANTAFTYTVVDSGYYKIQAKSYTQSGKDARITLKDSSDVILNPRAGIWSSSVPNSDNSVGIGNGQDVFFGGGVLCFLSDSNLSSLYFEGTWYQATVSAFVWLNSGEKIVINDTASQYIDKYEFS